jgi:O-antigen ligase
MKKKQVSAPANDGLGRWRLSLWLLLFGGILFFWPSCLDRYLAPRFFYVSVALLIVIGLLWKDLRAYGDGKLVPMDGLMLGWYGMNLASVAWAFSWSEGMFYAQKTFLLLLVYWVVRQALHRDADMVRHTFGKILTVIIWAVCGILAIQLFLAISQNGLDNESLYDYASGVFGNKSLAADALFMLLVFHVMLHSAPPRKTGFWVPLAMLLFFILLLQTRTVYLAVAVCGVLYAGARAIVEPAFRGLFLRRILPLAVVGVCLAAALIAWKGRGSSLAERLNPTTYLDSGSARERQFVWYKTGLLLEEHYWLGVGNGSWKFWFPSKNIDGGYRLEEKNVVFTRAHNDYLEIQSEMGIIGLALFCALFGWAFFMAIRGMRHPQQTPEQRHGLLVAALGLLGYGIIQTFDFPRERIDLQVMLAVLFAWITYYHRLPGTSKGIPWLKWPVLLLLALVLCGNIVIGWQRMVGEIHNLKLLEAQNRRDWKKLVSEATKAENLFYRYTDVALPLAWHEGIGWYQLEQIDKAVVAFGKAYAYNPWSFQVMNNYASALVKNQQYREAVDMYKKALEINPSFDDGKMNLSYVYLQLGEYEQSAEWLEKVDTIVNPTNDADRQQNAQTKARQTEFRRLLESKMK